MEAAEIQNSLKGGLREMGFELAAKSDLANFLNSLGNPDNWQQNAAAAIRNSKQPFELLIIGEHNPVKLGTKDLNFASLTIVGVENSFLVYSAQTGEKLREIYFTEKAYARDRGQALKLAVEKSGRAGAKRLAAELIPLINLNSGQKRLKLRVNNLTVYEDLTSLEQVIRKLEGIKSFKLQSFADNSASYFLNVMQNTEVLAERFNNEKEFPLQVQELGPDYLELKAN